MGRKDYEKTFKKITEHLGSCSACQSKAAADHKEIEEKICKISDAVQRCRDAARRILGKEDKTCNDSFKDKLAYSYPCKPTETCIDYEDYDPCESSEDITEKDLAILLKEEAAKLEKEKDNGKLAEGENVKKIKGANDAEDKQKQADVKQEEEEEVSGKKKTCKYIKNPFFTDRLRLSTSHLPLPPPGPPPQNFPLAGEDSVTKICPKKKKKCKKDDDRGKGKGSDDGKDVKPKDDGKKEEKDDGKDESEKDGEKGEEETEETEESDNNGQPCVKRGGERFPKKEVKKPCKKPKDEKPTCRRKESEVSVNFGPRKIPLPLKDPKTSPSDIPEVEQQLLMACGKSQEEECKKKCKKKDK